MRDRGQRGGHVGRGGVRGGDDYIGAGEQAVEHGEAHIRGHRVALTAVGLHAAVSPVRPGDGDAPPGARRVGGPAAHERLGGGIGGGVVALPGIRDHAGQRGVDGEDVEVVVRSCCVEVRGAVYLGREDAGEVGRVLVQVDAVVVLTSAVHDAVDATELRASALDRSAHGVRVGDVGYRVADLRAGAGPVGDLLPKHVVRLAARDEHEPNVVLADEPVRRQSREGACRAR